MQGILWKWTNYWMGWQPRWFILDEGVLSYYTSEAEATQGCKGSVSLSACDINVHPSDNLRLDIVIPGEQHIYVRASSTSERQAWLVALGTAKAQGVESRTRKSIDSTRPDAIKTKKSELRLYCDLLMQQVHSIKEVATAESGLDIAKLDQCTGLLSATCETFIKTLEDCVKISNSISPYVQASSGQLPNIVVVPTGNTSKAYTNGAGIAGSKEQKLRSVSHSSSLEH